MGQTSLKMKMYCWRGRGGQRGQEPSVTHLFLERVVVKIVKAVVVLALVPRVQNAGRERIIPLVRDVPVVVDLAVVLVLLLLLLPPSRRPQLRLLLAPRSFLAELKEQLRAPPHQQ